MPYYILQEHLPPSHHHHSLFNIVGFPAHRDSLRRTTCSLERLRIEPLPRAKQAHHKRQADGSDCNGKRDADTGHVGFEDAIHRIGEDVSNLCGTRCDDHLRADFRRELGQLGNELVDEG